MSFAEFNPEWHKPLPRFTGCKASLGDLVRLSFRSDVVTPSDKVMGIFLSRVAMGSRTGTLLMALKLGPIVLPEGKWDLEVLVPFTECIDPPLERGDAGR